MGRPAFGAYALAVGLGGVVPAVSMKASSLYRVMRKSFNIGIDPDPRKPRALNRLELAKTPQGAAEANALAAKGIAIERGVESEQIAGSEEIDGLLHARGSELGSRPATARRSELRATVILVCARARQRLQAHHR